MEYGKRTTGGGLNYIMGMFIYIYEPFSQT